MTNQFLEEFSKKLLFILLFWGIIIFLYLRKYLHDNKLRRLKYEWIWVMKKTKVMAIWKRYAKWDSRYSPFYVYRLESVDKNGNIYKSKEFEYVNHWWRSLEEMVKKYDGVIYDLWNKEVAIKQIEDNIQHLQTALESNPWFFKKMWLKRDIKAMKKYIEIANEWPINPYLVCNGHKVSVWDSIDVFVDPENPSLYYFDLDFTKQN
jgi:hypothetical protein